MVWGNSVSARWGSGTKKKVIRAIHSLLFSSLTDKYFKQNQVLKLNDIYKLKLYFQMYNYLNSPDIHNLFTRFQTPSDQH